jgi:hypothetical protein
MLDENEFPTRPYREEPVDRQAEDMVEEIHISDYVMVDFGFPGGALPTGLPLSPAKATSLGDRQRAETCNSSSTLGV